MNDSRPINGPGSRQWALWHKLWSKSAHDSSYNKAEWKELGVLLGCETFPNSDPLDLSELADAQAVLQPTHCSVCEQPLNGKWFWAGTEETGPQAQCEECSDVHQLQKELDNERFTLMGTVRWLGETQRRAESLERLYSLLDAFVQSHTAHPDIGIYVERFRKWLRVTKHSPHTDALRIYTVSCEIGAKDDTHFWELLKSLGIQFTCALNARDFGAATKLSKVLCDTEYKFTGNCEHASQLIESCGGKCIEDGDTTRWVFSSENEE